MTGILFVFGMGIIGFYVPEFIAVLGGGKVRVLLPANLSCALAFACIAAYEVSK
jgi:hypothetical protein